MAEYSLYVGLITGAPVRVKVLSASTTPDVVGVPYTTTNPISVLCYWSNGSPQCKRPISSVSCLYPTSMYTRWCQCIDLHTNIKICVVVLHFKDWIIVEKYQRIHRCRVCSVPYCDFNVRSMVRTQSECSASIGLTTSSVTKG